MAKLNLLIQAQQEMSLLLIRRRKHKKCRKYRVVHYSIITPTMILLAAAHSSTLLLPALRSDTRVFLGEALTHLTHSKATWRGARGTEDMRVVRSSELSKTYMYGALFHSARHRRRCFNQGDHKTESNK